MPRHPPPPIRPTRVRAGVDRRSAIKGVLGITIASAVVVHEAGFKKATEAWIERAIRRRELREGSINTFESAWVRERWEEAARAAGQLRQFRIDDNAWQSKWCNNEASALALAGAYPAAFNAMRRFMLERRFNGLTRSQWEACHRTWAWVNYHVHADRGSPAAWLASETETLRAILESSDRGGVARPAPDLKGWLRLDARDERKADDAYLGPAHGLAARLEAVAASSEGEPMDAAAGRLAADRVVNPGAPAPYVMGAWLLMREDRSAEAGRLLEHTPLDLLPASSRAHQIAQIELLEPILRGAGAEPSGAHERQARGSLARFHAWSPLPDLRFFVGARSGASRALASAIATDFLRSYHGLRASCAISDSCCLQLEEWCGAADLLRTAA